MKFEVIKSDMVSNSVVAHKMEQATLYKGQASWRHYIRVANQVVCLESMSTYSVDDLGGHFTRMPKGYKIQLTQE